jgi:hypothetical protein
MAENTAGLVGSGPHLSVGAELHAQHSVIDNGCYADADSLFISLGYNAILMSDPEQCVLTPVDGASTDLALDGDQMGLEALGDNGGGPPTHMPMAGSALIDAIPAESCIAELDHDQRGEPRNGGACDIGAVEVQPGE